MELRTLAFASMSLLNYVTRKLIIYGIWKLETCSLPTPGLGLGFSLGGFWNGKLIGTCITSYLTLNGSSGESACRKKNKKETKQKNEYHELTIQKA